MNTKRNLAVFLTVLILTCASAGAAQLNRHEQKLLRDALNSTKYALLIGIDEYASDEFPSLGTPVADARALRETLVGEYGYLPENIIELYNGDATRNNILDHLYNLAKREYKPGDSVLVYYAGHGFKDGITGEGYWIPVEGDPGSMSTFVTVADVHARVKAVGATHILLVSDSCFSGAFTERQRAVDASRFNDDGYLQKVITSVSRQIITSGGEEPVADASGVPVCKGHSVFACYLLKLLKENSGGYVTATDLYRELAKLVGRNSDQKPEMAWFNKAGDEGGEFVFVTEAGNEIETAEFHEVAFAELDAALDAELERAGEGYSRTGGADCEPRYTKNCRGDDVWWFDSCGRATEVETDCGQGATCRNAACVCGADYVMKDGVCEKISVKSSQTGYGLTPDNCRPGMEEKAAEIAGAAEALANIGVMIENTRISSETEIGENLEIASDYMHTDTVFHVGPMTIEQKLILKDFQATDNLITWKNVPVITANGSSELMDISIFNSKVQLYTGFELNHAKLGAILENAGMRISDKMKWNEGAATMVDVTVEVDMSFYE